MLSVLQVSPCPAATILCGPEPEPGPGPGPGTARVRNAVDAEGPLLQLMHALEREREALEAATKEHALLVREFEAEEAWVRRFCAG